MTAHPGHCIASVIALVVTILQLSASYGAETNAGKPSAADLVRRAIEIEDKFRSIPSIRIQLESKTHPTPRQVARLSAHGVTPRPEYRDTYETIYDSNRIRHRYENELQVALLEVWNGQAAQDPQPR